MKLYGMQQSRSFRCLWALEEAGIEYEYVPVKLRTEAEDPDSAQHPDYLALNVQGKVPTLINGDLVLTESVAILYYIGRCAPESGLLPNASMDVYAKLDEMTTFILAELEQPLWSKGKHLFALPEEQRIPQMFETARFEFAKAVNTLDHLLGAGGLGDSRPGDSELSGARPGDSGSGDSGSGDSGFSDRGLSDRNSGDSGSGDKQFAVADQFTIADILLAQTFNWAIRFEFDVPQKYVDLRNRHYGRPAARRAMELIA
jgi:glutathione S-transferase